MRVRGRGESAACCANCTRVIANLRWRWCRENSDANFEQEIITKGNQDFEEETILHHCGVRVHLQAGVFVRPLSCRGGRRRRRGGAGRQRHRRRRLRRGGARRGFAARSADAAATAARLHDGGCASAAASAPSGGGRRIEVEGEPVAFFAAQTAERLLSTEPSCVPSE